MERSYFVDILLNLNENRNFYELKGKKKVFYVEGHDLFIELDDFNFKYKC